MSIESIVDYVVKTPNNTNPNVIKSMVKTEVDKNTLQKAKEYTDSQRLAYIEPGKVLTFDGDFTDKETLITSFGKVVKISDAPADFNKIVKFGLTIPPEIAEEVGLEPYTEFTEGFVITKTHDGYKLTMNEGFIAGTTAEGVYVIYDLNDDGVPTMWVSYIEFAETIHPIDPKFLPEGAAKKTVLYSGTPQKMNTDAMGTLYVLTEDNLLEVAEGQNIYCELIAGGSTYSFVLNHYVEMPLAHWHMVGGPYDLHIGEVSGAPMAGYAKSLGGIGFGLMQSSVGLDIGEISLTLWTEIGGDKPYYISDLSLSDHTIPYININNVKEAFLRDALYYRNNDDQAGKAVGFLSMTDGFKAVFFIPLSDQAYLVMVTADSDNVTTSIRALA